MSKSNLLKLILWSVALLLVGLLGFSFVALRGESRYVVQSNRTRVIIKGGEEGFLSKEEVIRHLPLSITDTNTIAVSLTKIEEQIAEQIPYAKGVNAYISPASHQLTIQVESRKPTLRYFSNLGSFYLDDEGSSMHSKAGVSVYLPVVRVQQVDSLTLKQTLLPLSEFLQKHEEWATFFSVIEVKEGNRLHLYPRVGDYIFEVLGANNLEQELPKIHIFYDKIVPQVGANRYRLIKLSYEGQIVCKRRKS